jgi:xanthine/CO dehydrogenase XdhC/CoxF family maturation factor
MSKAAVPVYSHNMGPADWAGLAAAGVAEGRRAVVVFVTRHYGSTPRDQGSWMVVGADGTLGTLGGGEVEHAGGPASVDAGL